VIEGDEYAADPAADKTPKFMYLNPKIVVCTNIAYDHPDVYSSMKDTIEVYLDFFKKLPEDGRLLISSQVKGVLEENGFVLNYGRHDRALSTLIRVYDEAGERYENELRKKIIKVLRVPGEYNVRNALAAAMAAKEVGVWEKDILAGLAQYRGAKRRFEFIGETGGISLYDDYAHHPTEIRALAAAAKEKFPGKKIRFVFQPHTFSRTKALFAEFGDSLKLADETVMYPIFASAREEKDDSVSSKMLAEEIKRRGGKAVSVTTEGKLVEYLARTAKPEEIIFTVGAGNLYELHQSILEGFKRIGQGAAGG